MGRFRYHDTNECFETALSKVKLAARVVMEGFNANKNVEMKQEKSWDLVTEFDKRVEHILISELSKVYPDHKFIGEETTTLHLPSLLTDDPTWLIDPIDGTTNFVHACPHACISLALSVRKQLVLGIVYNPHANQLFTAKRGCGAYLNGKPIRASNCQDISEALVGYEISMARDKEIRDQLLSRFTSCLTKAQGMRTLGSAALSLCYVAMGAWDAYQVDYLYCWDYSAGALIIQEAGGVVIDTNGGEFEIMNRRILTAGTKQLADQLVNIVKKADQLLKTNKTSITS
ncbi:LOW QUALITY PROTEIN: inositol monophosphatase 2-like [Nilaparvata lugens]|uniref:LOW QUALITY PROTEIN: inositol monophosphatase 2-like n=1 Tax=Nilaparvata lugens TaxID=108931 RepID=UPI00193DA3C2|nr:LOW QUALITY PROTEIN: inositol monophosphatase 2-like [Nilaparvata lugens]